MFKGVNRYDTTQHTCMYMDIITLQCPCMLFDSTLTLMIKTMENGTELVYQIK